MPCQILHGGGLGFCWWDWMKRKMRGGKSKEGNIIRWRKLWKDKTQPNYRAFFILLDVQRVFFLGHSTKTSLISTIVYNSRTQTLILNTNPPNQTPLTHSQYNRSMFWSFLHSTERATFTLNNLPFSQVAVDSYCISAGPPQLATYSFRAW